MTTKIVKTSFDKLLIRKRPDAPANQPSTGGNTQVLLNGERLRGVSKITVFLEAKKVAHVAIEMFCDVEVEGLDVQPDYHDAEPLAPGERRYEVGEMRPVDDIRPKGTVQVRCQGADAHGKQCAWEFWVDTLHPSLPNGPFFCDEHCSPEELAERQAAMKEILKEDERDEENGNEEN